MDTLEPARFSSSVVTVTNRNDSGSGSLRAAIAGATSGEVINFAKSAYGTITLTSGPLVVSGINLTISGPDSNKLTISGDGNFTDFILNGDEPPGPPVAAAYVPDAVSISGITIADGNASNNGYGDGGGIVNYDALSISNSVLKTTRLREDQAPVGPFYTRRRVRHSLNLDADTFMGNAVGFAADANTGDLSQGGAICSVDGAVTIISNTFNGNEAQVPAPRAARSKREPVPLSRSPEARLTETRPSAVSRLRRRDRRKSGSDLDRLEPVSQQQSPGERPACARLRRCDRR